MSADAPLLLPSPPHRPRHDPERVQVRRVGVAQARPGDGMSEGDLLIAVGLPDAYPDFAAWIEEVGRDRSSSRIISAGTLPLAIIDRWVGIPPPPEGSDRVNLHAPEPREGESPQWLQFGGDGGFCCWTSDLIAVRVA